MGKRVLCTHCPYSSFYILNLSMMHGRVGEFPAKYGIRVFCRWKDRRTSIKEIPDWCPKETEEELPEKLAHIGEVSVYMRNKVGMKKFRGHKHKGKTRSSN